MEYLLDHGYYEINLTEMIDRMKISKGSFYYYFEDKDDIYLFIADQVSIVYELFAEVILFCDLSMFLKFFNMYTSRFLKMHFLLATKMLTEMLAIDEEIITKRSNVYHRNIYINLKSKFDMGLIMHVIREDVDFNTFFSMFLILRAYIYRKFLQVENWDELDLNATILPLVRIIFNGIMEPGKRDELVLF